MVIALAATFAVLSSLISGHDAARLGGHDHAGSGQAPLLFEAPVAELRQATTIDWRACLMPQEDGPPMTKEEFLQQGPARCRFGFNFWDAHRNARSSDCCLTPVARSHRLRLEHIRLTHLRSPAGITLIVAYDLARLHMFDGLCASWGGHISAAVYQVPIAVAALQCSVRHILKPPYF